MGLDPGDGNYEGGIVCAACEATLFGGKTPKYVLATFHNTVACPVFHGMSIDGAYLLTQVVGTSCKWYALIPGKFAVQYIASGISSLYAFRPFPLESFFFDQDLTGCQDLFFNANVCGPFEVKATGGIGVISWGPDTGLPC